MAEPDDTLSRLPDLDALVFVGDDATELRELLHLPEGANEQGVLIGARNQRDLRRALLDALALPDEVRLQRRLVLGGDFAEAFHAACVLGLACERDRAEWAERFEADPDQALDAMTSRSRSAL